MAAETVVDPALKKTVDLGPFKHKIDEGLPLRKTAFACLNTLLESVPERVNVGAWRAALCCLHWMLTPPRPPRPQRW